MKQAGAGALRGWFQGQNLLVAALLLLPVISLLPLSAGFLYPSAQAQYSDFSISHYPNAVYLQSKLSEGIIPLWSPLILSGYPFFASPLSGLWYPPGWLALLLPLPFGLNLVVLLHIFSAGAGMYLLARSQGLAQLPSGLAGIAFAGLPKLTAHLGAGHITMIYAISWTPWLLLSAHFRKRVGISAALIVAAITLADPRWLPYAAGTWFWFEMFIASRGESALKRIRGMGLQTIAGLLLAAPLLAPLWEYTRISSRAAMTSSDVLEFSLPWDRLLNLIYPPPGGFHEWILYPGAAVLLLALSALLVVREKNEIKKVRAWGVLIVACLVWALGENFPGLEQIARLPVLNWLRVPSRSLFISGMGLGMIAAYGLQSILQGLASSSLSQLRLLIFAMLVGVNGIGLGGVMLSGMVLPPFAWGMVGITAASVMLLIGAGRQPLPGKWTHGLLLLTASDLLLFGTTLVAAEPADVVLSERAGLAQSLVYLDESVDRGAFRVYSPSYSVEQQAAARYGLELADGVEPLQWRPYVTYMEAATGVPASNYSVTLPPFANGEPATANQEYMPDAELLGWLNVRYVASEYDLQVDGLQLIEEIGLTRVYLNQYARPRAWVQSEAGDLSGEIRPVLLLEREPNRVDVYAQGEGLLVLSELAYPGWEAQVDGEPVPLLIHRGIFRAVELPPGEHQVSFIFRPLSLRIGLYLFLVGVALLGACSWHTRRLRR